ncbi:dihydroorotase [Candidatus Anaplasma sp. TIGMIC]|uniref:dihydroorotase n=1 Tax=Candidatus Anaplasma sp. TIGMIC TaxID=3020713 RepID=UPI00233043A9|nr:dihydroorotase [Candidatus Anaplasma sp. TIGMIC]MDB1135190.1 dihydroorotase [Candidatus Anaplasma sp. TIGMIC]
MVDGRQFWSLLKGGQSDGYTVAYVNARVIDPESGNDYIGYVITKGSEIMDFAPGTLQQSHPGFNADEVVDCGGHVLMPGIVDLHVHLREPGGEYKETIDTGSRSAAAGGVTTVVCQPNTSPRIDSVLVAKYLKMRAWESSCVNIEFYGAITTADDELSDMASLHAVGALGFTDDGMPVMNALSMKKAFEYARSLGVVVAQHAEDCNLSNKGCINEGEISRELGLRGIPDISESIMVSRDIQLLREVPGAHYHVLHISTKKALDAVRAAKLEGLNVTCEVAPHHFTLNESAVLTHGPMAKMNPPLRTEEDRISMLAGLKDGTIDCIATDHAPHSDQDKVRPLDSCAFGIVGLETLLPLSLELYHNAEMSLLDVLAKLTYKPADIVKLPKGRIARGLAADLIIFDLDGTWTIDATKFSSKSQNSPFHGRTVKGKVLRTIVSGKTVYRAE